jgi:hypothetical protein
MRDELLEGLGDIPEYGGRRVLLPQSHYIVGLTLDEDVQVSDESAEERYHEDFEDVNGEQVLLGGTPFMVLGVEASDGPFQGCGFNARFYLTPGKGRNIGFVNHAIKAVTGKSADTRVLKEYGFNFPKGLQRDELQAMFRKYFLSLGPQDRLSLMTAYARTDEWNGATVIAKVGIEAGDERTDESTGETYVPQFNRIQGFHAVDDPKKGSDLVYAAWVKKQCFPKQYDAAVEMGLVSV